MLKTGDEKQPNNNFPGDLLNQPGAWRPSLDAFGGGERGAPSFFHGLRVSRTLMKKLGKRVGVNPLREIGKEG
jgi:hypothetical protein